MKQILWLIFTVIVVIGLAVFAWVVFPGPQIRQIWQEANMPVSALVGPQGPAGINGEAGPQGPAGAPGKDADPKVLLDDPAFQAAVDKAVTAQVALAQPTAIVPAATPTTQPGATVEPTKVGSVDTAGGAVVTKLQDTQDMGQWKVQYFTGATALMKDFQFTDFVPGWVKFPNEDWPAGKFLAKNGLEYGQELSDFCQQDRTCDFPVAARSYRTITADYNVSGIGECHEAGTGIGCALFIADVGDVTASFRNQFVDTGHTITGLYWNGDELDQAISAWSNYVVYRMVGVPSPVPANPGANCSVPDGCKKVDITFAIISGNELLVLGHTVR